MRRCASRPTAISRSSSSTTAAPTARAPGWTRCRPRTTAIRVLLNEENVGTYCSKNRAIARGDGRLRHPARFRRLGASGAHRPACGDDGGDPVGRRHPLGMAAARGRTARCTSGAGAAGSSTPTRPRPSSAARSSTRSAFSTASASARIPEYWFRLQPRLRAGPGEVAAALPRARATIRAGLAHPERRRRDGPGELFADPRRLCRQLLRLARAARRPTEAAAAPRGPAVSGARRRWWCPPGGAGPTAAGRRTSPADRRGRRARVRLRHLARLEARQRRLARAPRNCSAIPCARCSTRATRTSPW